MDRISDTQLQVIENSNLITWRLQDIEEKRYNNRAHLATMFFAAKLLRCCFLRFEEHTILNLANSVSMVIHPTGFIKTIFSHLISSHSTAIHWWRHTLEHSIFHKARAGKQ